MEKLKAPSAVGSIVMLWTPGAFLRPVSSTLGRIPPYTTAKSDFLRSIMKEKKLFILGTENDQSDREPSIVRVLPQPRSAPNAVQRMKEQEYGGEDKKKKGGREGKRKGTPEKCDECGALTTFAKDTVEKTEIKVEITTHTPYGNVNVNEKTSNTDKDLKDLEEDFM